MTDLCATSPIMTGSMSLTAARGTLDHSAQASEVEQPPYRHDTHNHVSMTTYIWQAQAKGFRFHASIPLHREEAYLLVLAAEHLADGQDP